VDRQRDIQTDKQKKNRHKIYIAEIIIAFRNLLPLLPTSGAISPPVLMPSLHTHDPVHRHTHSDSHVRTMHSYVS